MSSPLLWYVSCWCWAWKIPHSKNLQMAGSYWWACENSKAVCFPKQGFFSPLKRYETQKNICQFLFYFLTSIAYYSQIAKKDIYLNSGLTSTKNYGKTILTKVGEFPPLQSVNFLCTCVCGGVVCPWTAHSDCSCVPLHCDKLPGLLGNKLLVSHLSHNPGDKDVGHKTIVFVLAGKGSCHWMELKVEFTAQREWGNIASV